MADQQQPKSNPLDDQYNQNVADSDKKFEQRKQQLEEEYKSKMAPSQWAEVAETIGQALVQYGAARQGLKSGVNMSNLNMQKTDYEKPRSRFAEEYLTKLKMLYDQRSEESKEAGSLRRQKMEQDVKNQPKEDPYKQMQIDLQRDKLAEQKSQNEKKLAQAELSRISRVMDNPKMTEEQKAEALGKSATSKEERSAWNPARWFGDKEGFSKEKFNQQVSDRVQQLEAVVAGEEASPSQPQQQQVQPQPRQADPNTALRNILSKKRQ